MSMRGSLVAVLLLLGLAGGVCAAPPLRVAVTVPEAGLPESPLYVDLDTGGVIPPGTPTMRSEDGAIRCFGQWERLDERLVRLWFLPEGLPVGRTVFVVRPTRTHPPDNVVLTKTDKGVEVTVHGEPFTTYDIASAQRPVCFPLLGPTGAAVTRSYPLGPATDGEAEDHPHHQSLWFGLDKVGGTDFWSIAKTAGSEVHREFLEVRSGTVFGKLVAVNDWRTVEGAKVCEDTRTLRFFATKGARVMDYEVRLLASEGPLTLGDTKEGLMSCRVATPLVPDNGATLVNSEGQRNGDAWGKQATWVDCSGTLEGETVGVAILDAPDSFRHPTYWHARTYGLIGANPFGLSQFLGEGHDGSETVPAGGAVTFRYRWLVHRGTAEEARVADWYGCLAEPPVRADGTPEGLER